MQEKKKLSRNSIYTLALCGIMAALGIVLKFVATINIGDYIRIGLSNIPGIIISALLGPWIGGAFWGVLDVLKYIVAPSGPFYPLFTLSAVVGGILYGLILYKKPVSIFRVLAAVFVNKLVVTVCLNTLWLKFLYGYGIMAILPGRIISALVMLPIDTAITFAILKLCVGLYHQYGPAKEAPAES